MNPPGLVSKTRVEFLDVVDGLAHDTTLQNTLRLMGAIRPAATAGSSSMGSHATATAGDWGGSSSSGGGAEAASSSAAMHGVRGGAGDVLQLRLELEELALMGPAQLHALGAFVSGVSDTLKVCGGGGSTCVWGADLLCR